MFDFKKNIIKPLQSFFCKKKNIEKEKEVTDEISDFDYLQLTEIFFKYDWIRKEANHQKFENFWLEYKNEEERLVIKKLISKFKFLTNREALIIIKDELKNIIKEWNLKPINTIFVGFAKHKYADGSAILLNLLKPALEELDGDWLEANLYSRIHYGIERIKKGGNSEYGIELENVVIIDDFIGTGGTAIKIHTMVNEAIANQEKEIQLKVFSLAAMEEGLKKARELNIHSCITLKKGTELAYSVLKRKRIRKIIEKMEGILHEGNEEMLLSDYHLGYGASEALYSWSGYNMPNNNYPFFWWNKYKDGKKRFPMFNRMQ